MQLLRHHMLQVEFALKMRRNTRFLEETNQTKKMVDESPWVTGTDTAL